jgi:hypothetical protein
LGRGAGGGLTGVSAEGAVGLGEGGGGMGPSEVDVPAVSLRARWELAEVAAVAVLAGLGLIVVGAVLQALGQPGASWGSSAFLRLAGSWSGVLFGVVMLAVVGLGWWQVSRWTGEDDGPGAVDDGVPGTEQAAHLRRARTVCRLAEAGLVVNVAGAVMVLVGTVARSGAGSGFPHGVPVPWGPEADAVASLAGAAVVGAAGLWMAQRTIRDREAT